mgnify:CR=1 FL=1
MIYVSSECDIYHLFVSQRLIDNTIITKPMQFIETITKTCCICVSD